LSSIAGIIASIGTGIDHLIIITDEVLYEGKIPSTMSAFSSRIEKLLLIIIGAASTNIIAMAPLVVMGFGTLKVLPLLLSLEYLLV